MHWADRADGQSVAFYLAHAHGQPAGSHAKGSGKGGPCFLTRIREMESGREAAGEKLTAILALPWPQTQRQTKTRLLRM